MCMYCGDLTNDFIIMNRSTSDLSGIGIAMNKQGMLRVRTFADNPSSDSTEIIRIKYCPICGKKF